MTAENKRSSTGDKQRTERLEKQNQAKAQSGRTYVKNTERKENEDRRWKLEQRFVGETGIRRINGKERPTIGWEKASLQLDN